MSKVFVCYLEFVNPNKYQKEPLSIAEYFLQKTESKQALTGSGFSVSGRVG